MAAVERQKERTVDIASTVQNELRLVFGGDGINLLGFVKINLLLAKAVT